MWPNPGETADLVTFIGEILNGKLHFLCSVYNLKVQTFEAIFTGQEIIGHLPLTITYNFWLVS